ncbi:MAG: hypothetical protein AAF226_02780 [Verrucomicrobiota bacterium]
MNSRTICLFIAALGFVPCSYADEELAPLMVKKASKFYESNFDSEGPINKKLWKPMQATQWSVEGGVLLGQESTKENQAAKSHHRGLEPRVAMPSLPQDFCMSFSVSFDGGEETPIAPFVEFNHHVTRVKFSETDGMRLLAASETMLVDHVAEFKWEPGKVYQCLAERMGEEFVFQITGGPTLYAKHATYDEKAPSGSDGFGTAGPRFGTTKLDDVIIWNIAPEAKGSWAKTQKSLRSFEPIQVKEPKEKAPAKKP